MCGIVGYIGTKNAETVILKGLLRLEYRGYDSAGIALFLKGQNELFIEKKVGTVDNLTHSLKDKHLESVSGVGHTRWATHGKPSLENAHPIKYGQVTIVHNGIIENHSVIKEKLLSLGHKFQSSTDTEIVAHLLDELLQKNNPILAIRDLCEILKGAYALGIIIDNERDKIYFAKNASPMVLAKDHTGYYLASDQIALADFCPDYFSIEDGSYGYISRDECEIHSLILENYQPKFETMTQVNEEVTLSGHPHFMHKEIFEQPSVIRRLFVSNQNNSSIDYDKICMAKNVHIIACGSSYFAGLVAKDFIESILKIPVHVEIASEYRYRNNIINSDTLVIAISQSGETADTLAALMKASMHTSLLLGAVNVLSSAIAKKCSAHLGNIYLDAGTEVSVASTKAFLSQMVALKIFTLNVAKRKNLITSNEEEIFLNELKLLPLLVEKILNQDEEIKKIAQSFVDEPKVIYIARGNLYPIALEGALKMKELAYIFAEGYPAGELKHGPIATIDKNTPVIVLFGSDELNIKTMSNLSEVKCRGAKIISIAPKLFKEAQNESDYFIGYEDCPSFTSSIITTVIVQLLAYHTSSLKGLNVDKPRNLAKSVTVE